MTARAPEDRDGGSLHSREDPVVVGGLGEGGAQVTSLLRACGLELRGPLGPGLESAWATLLLRRPRWVPLLNAARQGRPLPQLVEAFEVLCAMFDGSRLSRVQLATLAAAAADCASLSYAGQPGMNWWAPPVPFKIVTDYLSLPPARSGDVPWGWRHPISAIMLPELLAASPHARYVHVVGHPLDAAWSSGSQGPRLWGRLFGVDPAGVDASPHNAQLAWWLYSTGKAVEAGRQLGERFQLIRLEQLCEHPVGQARRLAAFAGLAPDEETLRTAAAEVQAPESIDRWRAHGVEAFDPELLRRSQAWIEGWESAAEPGDSA